MRFYRLFRGCSEKNESSFKKPHAFFLTCDRFHCSGILFVKFWYFRLCIFASLVSAQDPDPSKVTKLPQLLFFLLNVTLKLHADNFIYLSSVVYCDQSAFRVSGAAITQQK